MARNQGEVMGGARGDTGNGCEDDDRWGPAGSTRQRGGAGSWAAGCFSAGLGGRDGPAGLDLAQLGCSLFLFFFFFLFCFLFF